MEQFSDECSCEWLEKEFSKDIRTILNKVCPNIMDNLVTFVVKLQYSNDGSDFFIKIFDSGEESIHQPKSNNLAKSFIENLSSSSSYENVYPKLKYILKGIYKNKYFFFSEISERDDYFIVFSIALDYKTYYNTIKLHSLPNQYLKSDDYTSFIGQIIMIELEKWKEIFQFNINIFTTINYIMSENAILQLAARDITEGRGLPSYLFFNVLSSMPYESSPCFGQIAFFLEEIDYKKKEIVEFENPIKFSYDNLRFIRKLLEITKGTFYLLSVKNSICGIAKIPNTKNIHILKFNGLMSWTLYFNNKQLVSYEKERLLYKTNTNKELLQKYSFSQELNKLILKLCEQKHGTAIIIFEDANSAKNETLRLTSLNRGIQLNEPYDLSDKKDYAFNLSSIDGAIILDKMCNCYGIGIILDGKANVRGDRSRGARFNSIRNYINGWLKDNEAKKGSCTGVVISEDGMVNICQ